MIERKDLEHWQNHLEKLTPEAILDWANRQFPNSVVFATSLGAEDQVLTHMLTHHRIPLFMLDTGRHFEETYRLLERTRRRYGLAIRVYFPETGDLEDAINRHGPNYFRNRIEFRKNCCFIRKVKPLRRALYGHKAWITGLRKAQAPTRQDVRAIEWDAGNGLYKINPLWQWEDDRVWQFIEEKQVPYNALHDRGYPSIGCEPCTRAVREGEDPRAGRWWWESPDNKECGLHNHEGREIVHAANKARSDEPPEKEKQPNTAASDRSPREGGSLVAI